jgi:hypothetical protein
MSARNEIKIPLKYTIIMMAVAWVVASSILRLPPASWFQNPVNDIQTLDAESQKQPFPAKPPFRFGSRALAGVCSEYGLDAASIAKELEGFAIDSKPEWSIKRIAKENDMEQDALFEVIRELSMDRVKPSDVLD